MTEKLLTGTLSLNTTNQPIIPNMIQINQGFAETDTVKIKHKKFKVCDLDLKAVYWDGDGTA